MPRRLVSYPLNAIFLVVSTVEKNSTFHLGPWKYSSSETSLVKMWDWFKSHLCQLKAIFLLETHTDTAQIENHKELQINFYLLSPAHRP